MCAKDAKSTEGVQYSLVNKCIWDTLFTGGTIDIHSHRNRNEMEQGRQDKNPYLYVITKLPELGYDNAPAQALAHCLYTLQQ